MMSYRILTEYQIVERMWNRPEWIVEYVNSLHRAAEDHFTSESEIQIGDREFEIKHDSIYQ